MDIFMSGSKVKVEYKVFFIFLYVKPIMPVYLQNKFFLTAIKSHHC